MIGIEGVKLWIFKPVIFNGFQVEKLQNMAQKVKTLIIYAFIEHHEWSRKLQLIPLSLVRILLVNACNMST